MAAEITITVDGDERVAQELLAKPDAVTRATVRALNRAINSARTVAVRGIAGDTGLAARDVRDALRMREATWSHPDAVLAASLKRIPLIKFHARGPEPSRGRGPGVTYRLRGSRGRHPHAFLATMPTGHRGVFVRKPGARRLPIQQLYGPSLGAVFDKFRAAAKARAQEVFTTNFDHEMKFAAGRTLDAGTD